MIRKGNELELEMKNMSIEEITLEVLAERALSNFDSKALVTWAINVLHSGRESENLFILAGLDHETTEEREKYFHKSLTDLNLSSDRPAEDLIEFYAMMTAKRAINGDIGVDLAFKQMLKIVFATEYNAKYIAFYEIGEDLDCLHYNDSVIFNPGLTLQNYHEFILEEFKIFLEMEKLEIPVQERDYSYCSRCSELVKPMLKTKYQLCKPHKYQVWCCTNCKFEGIKYSSEHIVKKLIIEKYKENEQNT